MALRRIFMNYREEDVLTNAYDVKLSSEDGTYGVRDYATEIAVVADDTTPDNPSIGYYYVDFIADNDATYQVSWAVIPLEGDDPIYQTKLIGPYLNIAEEIQSVSDQRGTFVQGTTATVMLKITDFDGNPRDPDDIQVTIQTNFGETGDPTVIEINVPEKASKGFYIYDWEIEDDQIPGSYQAIWEYDIDGFTEFNIQDLTVVEDTDVETELYHGAAYEMRLALESYLACAQSIPIYFEQARPTLNSKIYRFSFSRWNQTTGVKVYRNGSEMVTSGMNVDYFKGEVEFSSALTQYDMIAADYNFRWFSDEELNEFLENAVRTFNTFPPHSGYTLASISNSNTRFIPGILYKAATDALRKLMMCLQFQQPQQVFGGPEGAQKAFSNLETLKKNYEEEWKLLYEMKKLGPYVGLTRSIVVPEYTLPGGRCLLSETLVKYTVMNEFKYQNRHMSYQPLRALGSFPLHVSCSSLRTLYEEMNSGKEINILSQHDQTGELCFSPVSHIWKSDNKDVYELKLDSGDEIASSKEHLFYVNGKYIPLMQIKVGDTMVVSDGDKKKESEVKSIKKFAKSEMYDLEVPYTSNLFANGIKCHNSRWFRMLFKG